MCCCETCLFEEYDECRKRGSVWRKLIRVLLLHKKLLQTFGTNDSMVYLVAS